MTDERRHAPATGRNRDAILAILREILPPRGTVLEVASGTGEHAVHFAAALPGLHWLPSDPAPDARASIAAWTAQAGVANLAAPLDLDAAMPEWPTGPVDAIVAINMVHIAPWAATQGLMHGAGRLLAPGAPLVLYGPFRQPGELLAPSNAAFDADLRARDPAWGLRDLAQVSDCALASGLEPDRVIAMPANNLTVVFRRQS